MSGRSQQRRVPAVDGLRALAATSVVADHAWYWAWFHDQGGAIGSSLQRGMSYLRWGLVLFFVISGFSCTSRLRPRCWTAVRSRRFGDTYASGH